MAKNPIECKHHISKILVSVAKMIDIAGIPKSPMIVSGDPNEEETFFLVVWKHKATARRIDEIGDMALISIPYGEAKIEA